MSETKDGGYTYSPTSYGGWSNAHFDTREEAIAEARRELDIVPGALFYTAKAIRMTLHFPDLGEYVVNELDEENPECEDAIDVSDAERDDLDAMLRATCEAWAAKHAIQVNCFDIIDEIAHTFEG